MPQTTCGQCGQACYVSDKHASEGGEVYCSLACQDKAFPDKPMRHWQVERLMGNTWLTTDWYESGRDRGKAEEDAHRIAAEAGWEGVKLGKELDATEKNRYCSFAWITIS